MSELRETNRPLVINLLLAFVWVAVTGEFTVLNAVIGLVVGSVVLLVTQPLLSSKRYWLMMWHMIELAGRFLLNLVLSSLRIAADTLTPRFHMTPGVVAVPLDVETELEITVLANLISLTPGTLSLDVSEDRKTLFIHAMYIQPDDVDQTRAEIKQSMERRVVKALGQPSLQSPIRGKTVVFVVDTSESIDASQLAGAEQLVREALALAASEHEAGVEAENDEGTLKDVDHTPPDGEGANRVHERGGEHPDDPDESV